MIKKLLAILLLLPLIAASCNRQPVSLDTRTMQVGKAIVEVEVADTMDERAKGLSGRTELADNAGMLFVFGVPDRHTFWMKDTLIPLDFIWIRDGVVTEITANVGTELGRKDSELSRYAPAEPADSMLELNAGWAEVNDLRVGAQASFLAPGSRP